MSKKQMSNSPRGVVIDAEVLRSIRQHARSETSSEVCGVLIGAGEGNTVTVAACIAGVSAEQAGAHVTFTQDTWQHIYEVKDRDYPDERIIGWYHSHPGFGVFLSDHDTFIHRNFFSAPQQIAWVFDSVSDEEGCFVWQGKEILRAEKITVIDPKGGESNEERSEPALAEVRRKDKRERAREEDDEDTEKSSYLSWMLTVLVYMLAIAIVFALGVFLSPMFIAPREVREIIPVPVDPATGQILDPRTLQPPPQGAPASPGSVAPQAHAPAIPHPPAPASGTQPRKDQGGKH